MSGKKYKQLRREAKKHGISYEIVKKLFRRLNTSNRRKLLSNADVIDKHN